MFDAGYSVTCRDAALPVGKMYKLRDAARPRSAARRRSATIECDCAAPRPANVADLGAGRGDRLQAQGRRRRLPRLSGRARASCSTPPKGSTGYDSALQLGLRSIVADQPVKGEISIATTGAGDPAAFARVQAGTLDPAAALAEAYRRNNAGSYAEAAEFFAAVSSAGDAPAEPRRRPRQRSAAEIQPRPLCRSRFAVRRAPPSRSAPIRSSPAACAIIARSTCSTRATPRPRCEELDKPLPKAAARGRRQRQRAR